MTRHQREENLLFYYRPFLSFSIIFQNKIHIISITFKLIQIIFLIFNLDRRFSIPYLKLDDMLTYIVQRLN